MVPLVITCLIRKNVYNYSNNRQILEISMHGRCATYDAYWHAFNIVKGRFEEGEHIIFSDDIYVLSLC